MAVYLQDFAVYRPADELKVSFSKQVQQARKWAAVSVPGQSAGNGQPAIHAPALQAGIASRRWQQHMHV
jgi:hypothetical protein